MLVISIGYLALTLKDFSTFGKTIKKLNNNGKKY